MKAIICPKCNELNTLIEIGDGVYRCNACSYTGYSDGREIIKK